MERTLCENDIVITDGEKPVAIAGVMGGRCQSPTKPKRFWKEPFSIR